MTELIRFDEAKHFSVIMGGRNQIGKCLKYRVEKNAIFDR